MPVYEYRCPTCGRFDLHRPLDESSRPARCPTCAESSTRVFTVPGGRSTSGALGRASTSERALVDRARGGEPTRTGPPSGRRLPPRAHRH